jgi:hypothetical protein
MTLRWRLNLLSLGDLDAKSLGINVGMLRWVLIAVVSGCSAGSASWFRIAPACSSARITDACFPPLDCLERCSFSAWTISRARLYELKFRLEP